MPVPECRIKAIDFCRRYKRMLPDDRTRSLWPRWRILDELRKEFLVGADGDGRTYIAGLAWEPARRWVAEPSGRLLLV
jgi:hypothetical protein